MSRFLQTQSHFLIIVRITRNPHSLFFDKSSEVVLKDLLYYEEATEDFLSHDVIDTRKLDQMYSHFQAPFLHFFVFHSLLYCHRFLIQMSICDSHIVRSQSPSLSHTHTHTKILNDRGKILDHVRMCQSKPYSFAEYPLLRDFLLAIKSDIQVEDLDHLSQLREPSSINFELPRTASQGTQPTTATNCPYPFFFQESNSLSLSCLFSCFWLNFEFDWCCVFRTERKF
jgi:hypothetical protein